MPPIASALVLCLVVGIQDGDTLTARCSDAGDDITVKVRLAEIDAPEKRQPWGMQSKQSLSALCFGQQVAITPAGRDRYGRTIGRVTCQGKDASSFQVMNGFAWAYPKYLTDASVLEAEDLARTSKTGLWADKAPIPPWDWRHTK